MESFNTTKLSIQQPDNVCTLVITLAVAAANFLLMLLLVMCWAGPQALSPPSRARPGPNRGLQWARAWLQILEARA